MWLFKGAQSAVFYYAACTPCASSRYRRKRKKDAARSRDAPRDTVTDQPEVFHQPSPFCTNAYWDEEIALGPGPPSRRGGHKHTASRVGSQQNMASPVSSASTVPPQERQRILPEVVTDVLEELNPLKNAGERWNWIRYQREDEELWGTEVKGSSVGLSGRGRADTADSNKYYIARNPEVNDLHPPIVYSPRSKAETRWMLQPPPSAKVMAGRVRSNTIAQNSRDTSIRGNNSNNRLAATPQSRGSDCGEGNVEKNQYGSGSNTKASSQRVGGSSHEGQRSVDPPLTESRSSPGKNSNRTPSIVISNDHVVLANSSSEVEDTTSLRRPPLAILAEQSPSTLESLQDARNTDLHPHPSSSLNSRSNSPSPLPSRAAGPSKTSPQRSWHGQHLSQDSPSTYNTRSISNPSAGSGKAFRQLYRPSSPPTTVWSSDIAAKYIGSVHLEIGPGDDDDDNDEHEVKFSRRIRPWRWSMDI
ncbi:hypothetical protein AJ80_08352 [Polytolypa hystricis UAMH7299]|uniref:Uncharacterized protein n=1 Tax=Polytolypa hystricis (strain UAMH7299) TaxID=1447883 RepID=A0A2B7X197_POLH7|nr:hypothetical protein AJ80_08352 [Polytolypa hystricis UAMH7299]